MAVTRRFDPCGDGRGGHARLQQLPRAQVWRSTTAESAAKILGTGFNRSFCGVNATVYGEGVYFAASALLSMRYAKPDEQGRRYLFLCSVLCGRTGQGCRGLKEPPPLCVAPPS